MNENTPKLLTNNQIMMGIIRAANETHVPLGSIRCMKDDHAGELVQWKFKYDDEVGTIQHQIDLIPPDEDRWFHTALYEMQRMIAQKSHDKRLNSLNKEYRDSLDRNTRVPPEDQT